jgi:catalase
MPLPSDEKIVALAEELLQQCDAEQCGPVFGLHPGFRPAPAGHRHPDA